MAQAGGAIRVVRVSSEPAEGEETGRDHDVVGRIGPNLFRAVLPFHDYDFYLCGPRGFVQTIYNGLRDLSIADARIHAEAFGPSALVRRADRAISVAPTPKPAACRQAT